jgi:uncharacterized protein (DUF362 family)
VFVRIFAFFAFCLTASGANEAPPAAVPRARAARSTVWFAAESSAVDRFTENPTVSHRMVDALVCSVTGEREVTKAWRKLVSPEDRIGIKVNAAGGRSFATRLGVVRAVLDGLEQAGIPRSKVIVWDRDAGELREAGFLAKTLGCQVRAIDPPNGWDRTAIFIAPVLGKLIWGDALFVEKNTKRLGKLTEDQDQLSSNSHFAKLVTKDLTKIINVATLTDEAGCGVGGAFYNTCVRSVDNWRRFVSNERASADSIPEIYADPQLGPKVVLHFVDGLVAQYAGGPAGNPNYAFPHATIYASTDPVALDATAARLIDDWRKLARLPPIAAKASWLNVAEQMGLGNAAEQRIELKAATP